MTLTTIVLGNRYRDSVSGWEGVATARYEYMNGCVRIELAATDKDGAPKSYVFDQEQVIAVDAPPVERAPKVPSGGPRDNTPVQR